MKKFKNFNLSNFILKYQLLLAGVISFSIPLLIYILTLERKVIGGDTTWYALFLPQMQVLVPTGYPTFSIIGKIFSMIPIGELSYRLNLISAIFGALTILFLFLAIQKFTDNTLISLASSFTFAFLFNFWTVANRLEFDTINSFFVSLLLYFAFLYTKNPQNKKNLYLFSLSIGLSLTNHPLTFFILPAFILYIILINPKIFRSIKSILLSILFLILPLTTYAWLPIRSLQGYGPVTTLRGFLYYITGRSVSGKVHGGSFKGKTIETFSKVLSDFFGTIINDFGIFLLIIAIAGLIYLLIKNYKFGICSIFAIICNVTIIGFYLPYSPPNYSINAMIIVTFYLAFGFLLIFNSVENAFDKILYKNNNNNLNTNLNNDFNKSKINIFKSSSYAKFLKYLSLSVLLICFFISPAYLAASNYKQADNSKPVEVYTFWKKVFEYVQDNSVIYISSSSENIAQFINTYEQPYRNITLINNKDERYTAENVKQNIAQGKKVYFVGMEKELIKEINVKKVFGYYWSRTNEYIVFYNYAGFKKDLKITYEILKTDYKFGEKFDIKYKIINDYDEDLEITSLELEFSNNLKFLSVSPEGTITIEPSLSKGIYMWVKTFPIKAHSEINIVLKMQAAVPGQGEIDFRITSQDYYFEAEKVYLNITN